MGKMSKIWRGLPKPIQKISKSLGIKECGFYIYKWLARRELISRYITSNDQEEQKVAEYVKKYGLVTFPYSFTQKYKWQNIDIFRDKDNYPYIFYKGKKLFGALQDDELVKRWFAERMMEQDEQSPHCYCQNEMRVPKKGCTIAEIGAAEGMFSLEWIDRCDKVYLFECSDEWMEPLKRTFEPWKEKVEIIKIYVGNDEDGALRLDDFFEDKQVTLLKADIEGAELSMLKGGKYTFENKLEQVYITTYHRYFHPYNIEKMLREYGFETEFNKGFMLMYNLPSEFDKDMLRKAVIYGEK